MAVNQSDVNYVKNQLMQGEVVGITVKQRRVGPGASAITPTSVIATNMRVIIVNKTTLGFRKDFEAIPYKQIASVRLEKGIISSTVFIRVQGFDRDKGLLTNGKQEGEIDGLRNSDAIALNDYINKWISGAAQASAGSQAGTDAYCPNCGAKNTAGASFCSKCGAKLD
jgi:hypothetical protein